jgi:2,4-dienoyl-CoA reductase-like NADH-dependent reductase (Old Yellow Enzyme family)
VPSLDVLFQSYRLNALDLPNRVVMAPMTRSRSPGGVPTADVAGYYRRGAENGVGLIMTEAAGVGRPAALNEPDMPRFHGETASGARSCRIRRGSRRSGKVALIRLPTSRRRHSRR